MASICTLCDSDVANFTNGSRPPASAIRALLSADARRGEDGGMHRVVVTPKQHTVHAEVRKCLSRLALHQIAGTLQERDQHFQPTLFCHLDLVIGCAGRGIRAAVRVWKRAPTAPHALLTDKLANACAAKRCTSTSTDLVSGSRSLSPPKSTICTWRCAGKQTTA